MRVAAIYDVHANLPALDAVLTEIREIGVDRIVVGCDVVPGPMPCETMARLLALDVPVQFIHGNCDRNALAYMRGMETGEVPESFGEIFRWSAQQVQPDFEALIAGWPLTVRLTIDGIGDVLFCHATPRNDTEIFTRLTPEERLKPVFDGADASLVVCGHTHMQFDRMVGETRVVNAGSVGMPIGKPGAYWLLLGPEVELRRTVYDCASAAERIRATEYPGAQDYAENSVLRTPDEHEMLERYESTALR
jgi:predicted phosphodiesterase